MPEIIPSINVPTFEEVQERIKQVEPFVSWCHLDVTDGVFSAHQTWHEPKDLQMVQTSLNCEVHLMVERPDQEIEKWFVEQIKRVIVHLEVMKDPEWIIKKCREAGKEIGFAIKPNTFWGLLGRWFENIDLCLLLTVQPGASGQSMSEDTFEKIAEVRLACPTCVIEVDGEMNNITIRRAREAGANLFVAGSAIFSKENSAEAIKELQQLI